jgi:hypothetical protein
MFQELCVGTFVVDGAVVKREWANFGDISFDSAWRHFAVAPVAVVNVSHCVCVECDAARCRGGVPRAVPSGDAVGMERRR